MVEIQIERALDGNKAVMAETVRGVTAVQVWYGGRTVNVYDVDTGSSETWTEIAWWSISDSEGRAVEREEIEKHMAMYVARVQEGGAW